MPVSSTVLSSPAVGELDGNIQDGPEVVVGVGDGKVYAYHADGSTLAGFPVLLADGVRVRVQSDADVGVAEAGRRRSEPRTALVRFGPELADPGVDQPADTWSAIAVATLAGDNVQPIRQPVMA